MYVGSELIITSGTGCFWGYIENSLKLWFDPDPVILFVKYSSENFQVMSSLPDVMVVYALPSLTPELDSCPAFFALQSYSISEQSVTNTSYKLNQSSKDSFN